MTEAAAPKAADASAATNSSASAGKEGVNFSGTNNQEEGVDEADFVKTDGYNIFILNGQKLVRASACRRLARSCRRSTLDARGLSRRAMLLGDGTLDGLLVRLSVGPPRGRPPARCSWRRRRGHGNGLPHLGAHQDHASSTSATRRAHRQASSSISKATTRPPAASSTSLRMVAYGWLDVPGLIYYPELPRPCWQLDYDRRAVEADACTMRCSHAIAHNDGVIAATPLDDFVPHIYERLGRQHHRAPLRRRPVQQLRHRRRRHEPRRHLDPDPRPRQPEPSPSTPTTSSRNWSTVYASHGHPAPRRAGAGLVVVLGQRRLEEATNMHRFDISHAGRHHATRAAAASDGTVPATSSRSPRRTASCASPPPPARGTAGGSTRPGAAREPRLRARGRPDALEVVGTVGGIATGERIWSSRFVGDEAYLVTFRNIDPLWTIDLAIRPRPRSWASSRCRASRPTSTRSTTTTCSPSASAATTAARLDTRSVSLFDVSDFAAPGARRHAVALARRRSATAGRAAGARRPTSTRPSSTGRRSACWPCRCRPGATLRR